MKKDFVRDSGKIRDCERNRAQMNVFSYTWFRIVRGQFFGELKDVLIEFILSLGKMLMAFIIIIFYPIFALIKSGAIIKRAKKSVKEESKDKN